jgi:hypothetical protein
MKRPSKGKLTEVIIRAKGNISLAAQSCKVPRKTLYTWIEKYDLWDAVREGRERRIDFAEARLDKLIAADNVTAIIFFLKTQGRERGYVERQEITGADGEGINLTFALGVEKDQIPDD